MTIKEKEKLSNYLNLIAENVQSSIGYPIATDYDYSMLYDLFRYSLNNAGDPFIERTHGMDSFIFEREVIAFFAALFRAPENNYSGYVTNGGSEGNLYSLYMARELYPKGIVYHSSESHYSVSKSIRLLNMPSIEIRCGDKGEMDYESLKEAIEKNRHLPVIIVANIGTTMTEAVDSIAAIKCILQELAVESHYIHCDAALSGAYLPLVEDNSEFDFKNGIDSISCSGHKFLGNPFPCGIVVVKKDNKECFGKYIPYIDSLDTTISGSRNGHSPVFLWYAIKKYGKEGLAQRALESISLAKYTVKQLQERNITAYCNEKAITVVFPKPTATVCRKWNLATKENLAHLVCMPGISKDTIDRFIEDLLQDSVQNTAFSLEPTYI
ncbi:histidine decarboxylase [Chryseobacterium sp. PMSZPI]|uniref:histidine decarboxylase n=1 Tax=Chryseobacterium sp. PMSZPI TaxID=1033900 RepID=UPI000C32D3B5|nr:histidine decarboxylase [Chryseobacterium sp. PMSZPI]PKF75319.1 histidine decarboxylase [Chryseobacterium sp. PMSZPI]